MKTLHERLAKVQRVLASLVTASSVEFTAEDLVREFRDLDEDGAAEIMTLIADATNGRAASSALQKIDKLLENHGVEAIRSESENDRYFGDSIALYSNNGDTYATTILYDIGSGTFQLTTYGDWLEGYERENGEVA